MGPVLGLAGVMGLGTWLGFAFGVLAPFLVADLALSDLQVGALPSVMYATGAILAPLSGRLVDHLGGRRTCLLVPLAVAGANLAFGLSPGWAALVGAAVLGGIGLSSTNPATNRVVVESLPTRSRGGAMGWKQAGVSAAAFVVGAVLPAVAAALSWRAAAVVGAAVAVAVGAVLPRALPRPAGSDTGRDGEERTGTSRSVEGTALYAGLLGAVNGALSAYLVLYAARTLRHAPTRAGLAAAVIGLVAIGARVGWAWLGSRSGEPVRWLRTIAGMAALGCLGLAVLPAASVTPLLVVAAVLGVSAMSWQALLMVAAVEGVAVRRVGRVTGGVTRAFYGGYVIGPVLVGAAADAGIGYRRLWVVAAVVAAGSALAVRWSRRDREPTRPGIHRDDARLPR